VTARFKAHALQSGGGGGPRLRVPDYGDPALATRTLCTNPNCPGNRARVHACYATSIETCPRCHGYVARCNRCGGRAMAWQLLRTHRDGKWTPDLPRCSAVPEEKRAPT